MNYLRLTAVYCSLSLFLVNSVEAQPTPAGAEFLVNTYTTGNQLSPDIATAADGDFVVVWNSVGSSGPDTDGSVQGQRYASDGSAQGSEFQINSYTTNTIRGVSVAAETNGDFVVVWGNYYDGLRGQRFTEGGSTVGGEFTVVSSAYFPDVASDSDGDFVITWPQSTDIKAQRYNSSGVAQGGTIAVNDYTTSTQSGDEVVMAADGSFVVTWRSNGSPGSDSDNGSIQARRYASDGTSIGGQFQVNTDTTGNQKDPAIAMLDNGEFVIAWNSAAFSVPGNYEDIRAQRYASDGTAQGSEFTVNSVTASGQIEPAVAADGNDHYVFAWASSEPNGSDTEQQSLQARAFTSAGSPAHADFQVNTYTIDHQKLPRLVVDGNGNLIVVFQSEGGAAGDPGSRAILGQRYNSPVPVELITFGIE